MEKQQNRNFGNQLATIANFAISWQSVGNHCQFRNQLAISVRIAKFASHMHCSFVSHKNFKTLAKFRIANFANHIANFANHIANFANHFAKFATHCQIRKPIAKFANPLPNSQTTLPNSQTTLPTSQQHCQIRNPLPNSLALRNSHLQALSSSVINATDFQTW